MAHAQLGRGASDGQRAIEPQLTVVAKMLQLFEDGNRAIAKNAKPTHAFAVIAPPIASERAGGE